MAKKPLNALLGFFIERRIAVIIGLLVAGSFLSLSESLFPRLNDFNWDEAVYVSNGRFMMDWGLIPFASNPMTGLLYAVPYVIFRSDTFWMLKAASAGRVFILILFWIGMESLRKSFGQKNHPLIYPVLWALFAPFEMLLRNSSDALYGALIIFAAFFFHLFVAKKEKKSLVFSSCFIALAAMARLDGLVLFFSLLFAVVYFGWKSKGAISSLVFFTVPFASIICLYLMMSGLMTGHYELGIAGRTYLAFEQGEGFTRAQKHSVDGRFAPVAGTWKARELYGTPEKNRRSVFRAVRNNPGAFFKRTMRTLKKLPHQFVEAYGSFTGPLLLALAVLGTIAAIPKGNQRQYIILAFFSAPLLVYFFTFFRAGYLALVFFVLMIPAANGLETLFSKLSKTRWLTAIIALIALLQLTSAAASLKQRRIGAWPDEKAVKILRREFQSGTNTAAFDPRVPFAALQPFTDISSLRPDVFASPEDMLRWLRDKKVRAVYLDPQTHMYQPELAKIFALGTGKYWDEKYSNDDKRYRLFVVK